VLFERWSAQTYRIDNEEKILVRERNILGLLEKFPEIPAVTSSSSKTEITARTVPSPLMKTESAGLKKTPSKSGKRGVERRLKCQKAKPKRRKKEIEQR
jgi:hypothetical protein